MPVEKRLLAQFKACLEKERELVENELKSFAKESKDTRDFTARFPQFGTHTQEQDENADEVESYESTLLPIEHTLEKRLEDIKDAMARMRKGAYGTCEKCGKIISTARLKASPTAKTCLGCKVS